MALSVLENLEIQNFDQEWAGPVRRPYSNGLYSTEFARATDAANWKRRLKNKFR